MAFPTEPDRGVIFEGYSRAVHEFLRSFFKDDDTVIEINGVNYTFPGGISIEFTLERLESGENVIAFCGDKIKGSKLQKTKPIDEDTPTHPFSYEQWSDVHQIVYVKVSENKQDLNENYRAAVRIYDLLVLVVNVFARDFFSERNIDLVRITEIPANMSGKEYNLLAGHFQCRTRVKFQPQVMPTP